MIKLFSFINGAVSAVSAKKSHLGRFWGLLLFCFIFAANLQAQVINTFPYENSFETAEDIVGWTLVNAVRNNSATDASHGTWSMRINVGGVITTSELNLNALTNPVFSVTIVSGTIPDAHISADGVNFTLLSKGTAFAIPKTAKYIRLTNTGTYAIYADQFRIVESPQVVSEFTYENSFEDVADVDGWTFNNAGRFRGNVASHGNWSVQINAGGSITSPELNFDALAKPAFSVMISSGMTEVHTSDDGINFTMLYYPRS